VVGGHGGTVAGCPGRLASIEARVAGYRKFIRLSTSLCRIIGYPSLLLDVSQARFKRFIFLIL
jgi:hypothetical protein